MITPSKELLSEVLKENIDKDLIEFEDNSIKYAVEAEYPQWEYINIHELAHDNMKQWSFDNGYRFATQQNKKGTWWIVLHDEAGSEVYSADYQKSELEAIFKACEWILKQLEVK